MIFYFMVAALILIEAFILLFRFHSNGARKLFLWLAGVELWALIGLRSYKIGVDSITYYTAYQSILDISDLSLILSYTEPGYWLLNRFLGFVSPNPQLLFMFAGAVSVWATFRLIYQNKYYIWLSVILFMFLDHMTFDMAAMRQSLAVAILFVAYPFIIKRRILPFLLLVGIASTFHQSSVLFFIAYPLGGLTFRFKYVLYGVSGSIMAFLFFPLVSNLMFLILPRFLIYTDTIWFTQEPQIASMIKMLMAAVIFMFVYGAWLFGKNREKIVNSVAMQAHANLQLFFGLISFGLMLLSVRFVLFDRLAFYFYFFNILSIPLAIKMIKNPLLRFIACVSTISIALLYFGIIVTYRPEWWQNVPYQFFWQ